MGGRSLLKKIGKVLLHIVQTIAILICVVLSWILVNLITGALYKQYGNPFSPYLQQMIDAFFAVIVFVLILLGIANFLRPKMIEMMTAIEDALRQIAKGNFKVKLQIKNKYGDEFQKIAESVNSMAGELGQLESMRQDFISNVSHEIQSPLTSIAGFAQVLRNRELTPEQREHYLDIIEGESQRLSQMSDNLLRLSSLETDRLSFEDTPFRLDRQLRRIVLACEPLWLSKAIQVELNLDEAIIQGDEDLMNQVWSNLLNNSIKFTPERGAITINLNVSEEGATVVISDTGIGISAEDITHIFERFYKADKSRNRSVGGSGLGLSLVKKIIDLHQGNIFVESQIDQGTIFTIEIPKISH
jgi:two-component system phosphate regulon sensor histidine kinase PhoR